MGGWVLRDPPRAATRAIKSAPSAGSMQKADRPQRNQRTPGHPVQFRTPVRTLRTRPSRLKAPTADLSRRCLVRGQPEGRPRPEPLERRTYVSIVLSWVWLSRPKPYGAALPAPSCP